MGSSVAAPPLTQYAALEMPTVPTEYTSLLEIAIPPAEELPPGAYVVLLGMGNVVAAPFIQYAALVLPVAPLVPLPATYTSLPRDRDRQLHNFLPNRWGEWAASWPGRVNRIRRWS